MQVNIVIGGTGFFGNCFIKKLVRENIEFILCGRDLVLFQNEIDRTKCISDMTKITVYNFAFDFKNHKSNLVFIQNFLNIFKKRNLKIYEWFQVSSINAYPYYLKNQECCYSIKNEFIYDSYGLIKYKIDNYLLNQSSLITRLNIYIVSLVDSQQWINFLNSSMKKYIPIDYRYNIVKIDQLVNYIFSKNNINLHERYNLIYPPHTNLYWNDKCQNLFRHLSFKFLNCLYNKHINLFTNAIFKKFFNILYRITKIGFFALFVNFHTLKIVNNFLNKNYEDNK